MNHAEKNRILGILTVAGVVAFVAGCGAADDSTPAADGSSGTTSTGGNSATGGNSGNGGSSATGGSAVAGWNGSGVCNTLANVGSDVPVTTDPDAAPEMTGGAIADGIYVLTSQVNYAGDTLGNGTLKETIEFTGNTVQVVRSGPGEPDEYSTAIFTLSDAELDFTLACPDGNPDLVTLKYTATPTTFTRDLGNWVLTSTKL